MLSPLVGRQGVARRRFCQRCVEMILGLFEEQPRRPEKLLRPGGRLERRGIILGVYAGLQLAYPIPAQVVLEPVLIRSEEHTSELQSHLNLVCRLLLEKKK